MKRWLPIINLVLFVVLLVTSLFIQRQEHRIIALQRATIEYQQHAIAAWQIRAAFCCGSLAHD